MAPPDQPQSMETQADQNPAATQAAAQNQNTPDLTTMVAMMEQMADAIRRLEQQ